MLEGAVTPLTHVVGVTNTTVTITASNYAPTLGTTVTYTVVVASPSATPPPVGQAVNAVTVQDQSYGSGTVCTTRGACLSAVPGNPNQISGTCVSPVYNGTVGTVQATGVHNISVLFASNDISKYSNGTSNTITVTAGATPTTISAVTVSAGSPSAPYTFGAGSTLGFTVTVSPTTGNPAYTGRVQFFDSFNNGSSTVTNQLAAGWVAPSRTGAAWPPSVCSS